MLFLLGSAVQWAMRGRSMCSQWRSHCDKRWFEGATPTSLGGPSMPHRYMLLICGLLGVSLPAGWAQAQQPKVLRVALAGTMEQVISRHIGPAFRAETG